VVSALRQTGCSKSAPDVCWSPNSASDLGPLTPTAVYRNVGRALVLPAINATTQVMVVVVKMMMVVMVVTMMVVPASVIAFSRHPRYRSRRTPSSFLYSPMT
jgi:hypothetical protein